MTEPRLAIEGDSPIRTSAMPSWPQFGDAEANAVAEVVRSGKLNYWVGDQGTTFEAEYAASLGRKHALAVGNGTLALELALRAFRIGPGDDVVVPSRTFVATAGAVVAVSARPIVADVDLDEGCLTADTIAAVLTPATRAVIPVHLGGWPCDMTPIMRLAEERGLVVIEDCAQAHGGAYAGRPLGSIGHAAAFSFCQDKIISVGEGGMVVVDDDPAFERAWSYRDHGKSRTEALSPSDGSTCFRWMVEDFGSNFRLGELQSALGRLGLANLPVWHHARTDNALRIADAVAHLPGITAPLPAHGHTHAFYRLYARVLPEQLGEGWDRDRVTAAIAAEGVPVQYGTCAEIYRERAFAARGFAPEERLPVASSLHETSLAFFVHPTLTDKDIDDTIAAVTKVMEVATR